MFITKYVINAFGKISYSRNLNVHKHLSKSAILERRTYICKNCCLEMFICCEKYRSFHTDQYCSRNVSLSKTTCGLYLVNKKEMFIERPCKTF